MKPNTAENQMNYWSLIEFQSRTFQSKLATRSAAWIFTYYRSGENTEPKLKGNHPLWFSLSIWSIQWCKNVTLLSAIACYTHHSQGTLWKEPLYASGGPHGSYATTFHGPQVMCLLHDPYVATKRIVPGPTGQSQFQSKSTQLRVPSWWKTCGFP